MSTTAPAPRPELPPMPARMKRLKLHRGYPVPWFVAWLDGEKREVPVGEGEPDFRILRTPAIREALRYELCWICGGQLGRYKAFVIGPMCMVNRINSEPPSHLECADYAARACPFLSRPHMVRRENNRVEGVPPAGVSIDRNPGCAVVWITDKAFPIKRVNNGILFDLPDPTEMRFYAEGRVATYAEIEASIESGLPFLLDVCATDEERDEVRRLSERALAERVAPVLPR